MKLFISLFIKNVLSVEIKKKSNKIICCTCIVFFFLQIVNISDQVQIYFEIKSLKKNEAEYLVDIEILIGIPSLNHLNCISGGPWAKHDIMNCSPSGMESRILLTSIF